MSFDIIRSFEPQGNTVNLAVLTTTANVAITNPGSGTRSLRIANIGTNNVFINFGKNNSVTAVLTTSIPLLANSVSMFQLKSDITHVAAIAAAIGNTIYCTTGENG